MEWRVPLADIDIDEEEVQAAADVVRSRWLSMGAITQKFEEEFAAFIGVRHAIAVTNATAALHLACIAAGLGPGDEVITPSLTFVATANAIRYTGAVPVFADIESLEQLTVSPASIEARITGRTRAIMVMHYGGFPCDMPAIMEIARKHDLVVLEDSAHAIGSELEDRSLGTWGAVGCYSFFSNKNMTTGEGGMLVTQDPVTAERLRLLRSHGMTTLSWDRHQGHAYGYDVVDLGYNYRIDEMRSAIGRVQLRKLPAGNERRRTLTERYRELFAERVSGVKIPFIGSRGTSCHHIFSVLLPDGTDRTAFQERMKEKGVQTSNHYPPVHHFMIYREDAAGRYFALPLTEVAGRRQVTLPLYPAMTMDQVVWVVEAVRESLEYVST